MLSGDETRQYNCTLFILDSSLLGNQNQHYIYTTLWWWVVIVMYYTSEGIIVQYSIDKWSYQPYRSVYGSTMLPSSIASISDNSSFV